MQYLFTDFEKLSETFCSGEKSSFLHTVLTFDSKSRQFEVLIEKVNPNAWKTCPG
jgi:hypothetical protein